MDQFIKLDEKSYKKISKKLSRQIQHHFEDNKNITLQNTQEILAQALGFRNEHSLLNYFNKPSKLEARKQENSNFFQTWEESDILFFLTSIFKKDDTMWSNRAVALLSTVVKFLVYMRDKEEILLSMNTIREYLILDNIVKIYKTRRDFPNHIRSALRAYLVTLPGFQETAPLQSDTTKEQHGYIQMQFDSIIDNVVQMEKYDPIIFMPEWFHAIYSNQPDKTNGMSSLQYKIEQETPKTVYKRLFENEMEHFYSEFDHEEWENICSDHYQPRQHDKKEVTFRGIDLIHPIARHGYFQNSWLADNYFQDILKGIIRNKDFKCFYLSDLILYTSRIVNQQKQANYMHYVQYLLNNYATVVKYSKVFCELAC